MVPLASSAAWSAAMKKLFDAVRLAWKPADGGLSLFRCVPSRGARYQANVKWVMPQKEKFYRSSRTGDLVQMPVPNPESIYLPFRDSKELADAEEKVKKVFSLGYQKPKHALAMYANELTNKVKSNAYDKHSKAIEIAELTAKIRFHQPTVMSRPSKFGPLRKLLHKLIKRRKFLLACLRREDYKKFEWLLDELDLEFRPAVAKENRFVSRKKSLELLAKLKVEQIKEERLAALKKTFDEEKVPFLEKKIKKLKEIQQIEEKNNLPVTVTEKDIEECIRKLEEVKVQVAERAKRGYKRKIHPYFLEAYEEDLLWEKEKAGEIIREQGFCRQNNSATGE